MEKCQHSFPLGLINSSAGNVVSLSAQLSCPSLVPCWGRPLVSTTSCLVHRYLLFCDQCSSKCLYSRKLIPPSVPETSKWCQSLVCMQCSQYWTQQSVFSALSNERELSRFCLKSVRSHGRGECCFGKHNRLGSSAINTQGKLGEWYHEFWSSWIFFHSRPD